MLNKDAGKQRGEGFQHENNDCVVRALSVAAGMPYANVHAELKAFGRRDGRKVKTKLFLLHKNHSINGYTVRPITPVIPATLGQLRRSARYQQGRFLVLKSGHAFAVVNGVVSDYTGDRVRLKAVWELVPQTKFVTNEQAPKALARATADMQWDAAKAVEMYRAGSKVVDIAVFMGYERGSGQNRVRVALIKAGVYQR